MILVVGLGNPGMKYKSTYHNVGFQTVDEVAKTLKVKFDKNQCDAKVAKGSYNGCDFVLAKPQTYMNNSGEAVKKLVNAYVDDVSYQLLVVYDDIDLPLGALRLKNEGSAGTHNGMRNIVSLLNTDAFSRLRVGIKNDDYDKQTQSLADFVLSKTSYDKKAVLTKAEESAAKAVVELISGKPFDRVQEWVNRIK